MTRDEQREASLIEANRLRLHRSALKRELRDGKRSLAEILRHPDCGSMLVFKVITSQHRWGEIRAAKMFQRLHMRGEFINPARKVSELTERQKDLLIEVTGEVSTNGFVNRDRQVAA